MDIRNKRIPDAEFEALRSEVLTQWPTGRDVNLDEAVAYHKSMPESRVFSKKLLKAKREHRTLIQPRAGVPVVEKHIELLQHLEKYGEADLLPTTIDSYTRQNRYKEAENGISESIRLDRAMLNGFPAVNHGVAGCRRVIESVNVPVQIRHGTPDARLLAEITFAGGFTSYEGGGISYNLPYCKNVPMERTITDWQYVDRLTGLYEEMGVPINREPYGPLTGTLVPAVHLPRGGHHRSAAGRRAGREEHHRGLRPVRQPHSGHRRHPHAGGADGRIPRQVRLQRRGPSPRCCTSGWAASPPDEAKAFGVISMGSAIAALSKATKVIVKTPHEAVGIPTMEANAAGLRCTKQVVNMLADQVYPDDKPGRGRGDHPSGDPLPSWTSASSWAAATSPWACARGVEAGALDVPFAPCRVNAGQDAARPGQRRRGAHSGTRRPALQPVPEGLPHGTRSRSGPRPSSASASFQMVIDDVYAIGKGRLVGRPASAAPTGNR